MHIGNPSNSMLYAFICKQPIRERRRKERIKAGTFLDQIRIQIDVSNKEVLHGD